MHLPVEIWAKIFQYASGKHGVETYFAISMVNKHFHNIIALVPRPLPKPKIYLSDYIINELGIVPMTTPRHSQHMISYQQLLDIAGPYSGVGLKLPSLLEDNNMVVEETVLVIQYGGRGWFELLSTQQNPKSLMNYCKQAHNI